MLVVVVLTVVVPVVVARCWCYSWWRRQWTYTVIRAMYLQYQHRLTRPAEFKAGGSGSSGSRGGGSRPIQAHVSRVLVQGTGRQDWLNTQLLVVVAVAVGEVAVGLYRSMYLQYRHRSTRPAEYMSSGGGGGGGGSGGGIVAVGIYRSMYLEY